MKNSENKFESRIIFDGIERSCVSTLTALLHENRSATAEDILLLERYSNDIHRLFLKKLSDFCTEEGILEEDAGKLRALLEEIIKIKVIVQKSDFSSFKGSK